MTIHVTRWHVHTLRALGISQLVLAVLGGAVWLVSSVGVAMCTDGRPARFCTSVSHDYAAFGLSVGLALAVGALTTMRAGSLARHRAAALLVNLAATSALAASGWLFWSVAS